MPVRPGALLWLIPSALLGLYLLVLLVMAVMERRFVFKPPPTDPVALKALAERLQAQELHLRTSDGVSLYGWRVGTQDRLALLFTGNSSAVGSYEHRYRTFLDLGLSVLHVNYRGYPGSEGRPSERGLRIDAMTAWEEARRTHAARDIVVYGKSLGGAVALGLVASLPPEEQPRALILDSTFTRATDVAASKYPYLPVGLIMSNRFASIELAPTLRCPTLVVHGTKDELVPLRQPQALAAAIPGARLLVVEGLGHNDDAILDPGVRAAMGELIVR